VPVFLRRKPIREYISSVCIFLFVSILLSAFPCALAAENKGEQKWVATWTTANADLSNLDIAALAKAGKDPTEFSNQTIRGIVRTTIGGRAVRIRLANTFGTAPVKFDAVFVGLQKQGASIVPDSNRVVTFGGAKSITIPEGSDALSDEIALSVGAQQNLAISLFTSKPTGPATIHFSAFQTNYFSGEGNFAAEEGGESFTKTTGSWVFLAEIDVLAPTGNLGAIVALGDSITDGASSKSDAYERWTDVLARRFTENQAKHNFSVLNAGIGGNRVLSSSPCFGENALARLDRDVFSPSGVRSVILFEGTNDIGQPDTHADAKFMPCLAKTHITADDLIAGYKQIIAQVHARHLKIFGATILPFQGFNGWTEKGEATRLAVNRWIKESRAFDGVIDLSGALTDPENPTKLASQYDSGDHLHPNSAGHAAMARAVDLSMFSK
jgi:lysophospholipase L1-like esterase